MDIYGVINVLFNGGLFLIALLAYLDNGTTSTNKKAYPVSTRIGDSH